MNAMPMVRRLLAPCPLCLLLLSPWATWAQVHPSTQATQSARVQDASAAVPSLRYSSVLQHYRPLYEIQEPASWVQSIERVGRIGGWRAYAREMHEADAPAASVPQPPSKAQHDSHAAPATQPAAGKHSQGHQHHGSSAQHGGHKP